MLHCRLLHSGGCVIVCIDIYTIMQLPLCHRLQYKTEWMFKFIKNTNNFGRSTQVLLFGNVLPTGATPIK